MSNISGKGIFFAELDDDFQELQTLTEQQLLERTACYFLLAPSLIIHPAYVWQSDMTNRLINVTAHELLRPPFAQLELGRYASIDEYMSKRVETLRRPQNPTRELRAYELHGDQLLEEAKDLSRRFETAVSRDVSATWRDQRFRDLLSRDLGATDLDRVSLAAQFGALRISPDAADKGREIAEFMQRFVRTTGLVSVDTFLRRVYDLGLTEFHSSPTLRRRLLALYYETYADSETVIPATSKLLPGSVVNPYEVDVFWRAMVHLFGPEFRVLSQPTERETVHALRAIRESPDWAEFVSLYFDILGTIDQALWDQPSEVIKALDQQHPGKSHTFVLKQLWQRRKFDLAGAAFGVVGMSSVAVTPVGVVAVIAGGAGVGITAARIIAGIRRFVGEYRSKDLVRVKAAVGEQINRALVTSQPDR